MPKRDSCIISINIYVSSAQVQLDRRRGGSDDSGAAPDPPADLDSGGGAR